MVIDEQESVTALLIFVSLSAREGQRSDGKTHGERRSIGGGHPCCLDNLLCLWVGMGGRSAKILRQASMGSER